MQITVTVDTEIGSGSSKIESIKVTDSTGNDITQVFLEFCKNKLPLGSQSEIERAAEDFAKKL